MKWFISAIAVLVVLIGVVVALYKPAPKPSDISAESMRSAVNQERGLAGLASLEEHEKLQKIVDDAVVQVSRVNVSNLQDIKIDYGTNSQALRQSIRPLSAVGLNTADAVVLSWKSESVSRAILLNTQANLFGVATGKTKDGVNVVFVVVAYCTVDC